MFAYDRVFNLVIISGPNGLYLDTATYHFFAQFYLTFLVLICQGN